MSTGETLSREGFVGRPIGPRMGRRFGLPFGYMAYNSDERVLIREVIAATRSLAQSIGEVVPAGRDHELALEHLEEVLWRSIRGIGDSERSTFSTKHVTDNQAIQELV